MLHWLLVSPAFAVSSPAELQDPRATDRWVVDQANVLDDDAEKALNRELLGVLQEKGAEVLVVTVDRVEGDPGLFALDLFRAWSPGRVNSDRGALILVVTETKSLAVNAGIGLMADLTDPWVASLQTDTMVPELAKGDVNGALTIGVAAIRDRIGSSNRTSAAPPPEDPGLLAAIPVWGWIGLALVGVAGLIIAGVRMASGDDDDEDDQGALNLPPPPRGGR